MLLDHARQAGIRLVQVSTDEVYGDIPLDAQPCTEEAPLRPSSPYSASKTGGDLQVLAYVRTYGVDACITRGANNYGPRQYPEKFLPLFITNAFEGEPLPVYGDGRQRREWLHAADYSSAIDARAARGAARGDLQRRRPGAREHGGRAPDPRPHGRLARPRPPRRPTVPGTTAATRVDSSKVRALGWTPEHSFDAGGLEETVAWYRDNRDWWEPIKSGEYRGYYEQQYRTGSTRRQEGTARRPKRADVRAKIPVSGADARARALVRCRGGPARRGSGGSCRARAHRRRLGGRARTSLGSPGALVITGHGWGHGVGMSQWGAYGYALHGWDATRILIHYFPGTTLGTHPAARPACCSPTAPAASPSARPRPGGSSTPPARS